MIVILFSQACNETKWVNEQNGWLAADIFGVSVKKASVMKFLPEYYGTVDYDFLHRTFGYLYVCARGWVKNFQTSRLAFELGLNSASWILLLAGRGRERKIAIGGGTRDELWKYW